MADISQVTKESIELMKGTMPAGGLSKAMTTATDFSGYNLEDVAKSLVPFDSPERNRIPRKVSPTGQVAHFKTINAIKMTGGLGRIEGQRGSAISYVTQTHDFPFKSYGIQDGITREQMAASRGFEQDLYAKQHVFGLLRLFTEEEKLIIGGNITALGTVAAPSYTSSTTGGSLPASTTYYAKVAAVTLVGAEQGVTFDKQYTGITLNGFGVYNSSGVLIANATNGVTAASTATTCATGAGTATNSLILTATPVAGAVAYAWFVGTTSGSETLQMVTSCSTATITQIVTGGDSVANFAADGSGDAQVFDGYIPQIINGGGYYYDAKATTLHKSPSGVQEIDDMFASIYNQFKISPDRLICGVQAFQDITSAIVSTGGAPLMLVQNSADQKANLVGGYRTTQYINKATGSDVTIKVHPWLPPSTVIAITETIPYPNSDIPRAIEMELGYKSCRVA